jgi:proton-dependent oligopeptide transporter, POT family
VQSAETNTPSTPSATPNPADSRFPPQVKYIVGNEACERFSFYGMKFILMGYITGLVTKGGLGQTKDQGTTIISLFSAANYFMPLLGAWISDRLWGRYRTILWISFSYCVGHGVLAMSDLFSSVDGRLGCLYAGLALIAFGAGGIKPCVSAFMGDQFKASQSHLLNKAYGAFYWSINFGSFFAALVIPWIKDKRGYSWAFGVPGILMALATLIFWLGRRNYVLQPPARDSRTAGFLSVLLTAWQASTGRFRVLGSLSILGSLALPMVALVSIFALGLIPSGSEAVRVVGWFSMVCVIGWMGLVLASSVGRFNELPDGFWQGARGRFNEAEIGAARSVSPILTVLALVPIFWSLFDQSHSTWLAQGKAMVPSDVFGMKFAEEQMLSANPLLVMLLVPLFTLVIYPALGTRATHLRKMGCGLFVTAFSYVIVALLQSRIEAGDRLSIWWQVVPYVFLTTGEVLVSTTGLEFAFTQAAPTMKSTVTSFWLLTVTFGNLFVVLITKLFGGAGGADAVTSGRFMAYAGLTALVGVVFVFVASRYQYRTYAEPRPAG